MPEIHVSDEVFAVAERQANAAGFASVEEFVVDLIEACDTRADDYDAFFTPEILAQLDEASREVANGGVISSEEITDYFKRKSAAWPNRQAP